MSDSLNRPVPYSHGAGKQADQKFCHACGMILHSSATSCVACGAAQVGNSRLAPALLGIGQAPLNHVFCHGCGQTIHHSAPLCPHCGAPQRLNGAIALGSDKSRIAAAILALVFGGLGFHKFYLGEIGLGVLYLLFSWTFIPAAIGAVEGLVYLFMSDDRFAQKYG
jgi:TM2 domain-containing membrane protein YozV